MEPKESIFAGELSPKSNTYQKDYAGDELYTESTGDYILPDYQPEIRKILLLNAEIEPSGQYESGGRATFGGSVRYKIVYSDADGKPAAVELSSDYDYAVEGGDAAAGACIASREYLVSVNCRLSGPRKLNIRTRVGARVHMMKDETVETDCPVFADGESPELLYSTAKVGESVFTESESPFTREIPVPDADAENLKILSTRGEMLVREARAEENGIRVRGEMLMTFLLTDGSGFPFTVTDRSPFDEFLEKEGISSDCMAVARGRIGDAETRIENDEKGACIVCDATAYYAGEAFRNLPFSYTADAYSPTAVLGETTEDLPVLAYDYATVGHFTLDGSVSRKESDTEDASTVVDCIAEAENTAVTVRDGTAVVSGDCRVHMLVAAQDGDSARYSAAEFVFPFRGECDMRGKKMPEEWDIDVGIRSCRGRLDPAALAFGGEAVYTLVGTSRTKVHRLSRLTVKESRACEAVSRITVTYPEENDTLWSIGKRYLVPISSLCEVNHIDAAAKEKPNDKGSLGNIGRLLIVK